MRARVLFTYAWGSGLVAAGAPGSKDSRSSAAVEKERMGLRIGSQAADACVGPLCGASPA